MTEQPKITFDSSTIEFVLEALGYSTDENGFVFTKDGSETRIHKSDIIGFKGKEILTDKKN